MTQMTTEDGVPVFGAGTDLEGTLEFAVEALHVPTGERVQHRFRAWRDPGPEFVLAFIRSGGSDEAAMHAGALLLNRALVDHDGISVNATPDTLGGKWSDNPDDWSSKRRFTHLVSAPDSEFRVAAMMLIDLAGWLAKEAFNRNAPIQGEPVPTAAPAPSRRGRTTTRSGSTAKRPRKA